MAFTMGERRAGVCRWAACPRQESGAKIGGKDSPTCAASGARARTGRLAGNDLNGTDRRPALGIFLKWWSVTGMSTASHSPFKHRLPCSNHVKGGGGYSKFLLYINALVYRPRGEERIEEEEGGCFSKGSVRTGETRTRRIMPPSRSRFSSKS